MYFEKAREVSSDVMISDYLKNSISETIAEVGLFLKKSPYQNIETKIIYDHRICRELHHRV